MKNIAYIQNFNKFFSCDLFSLWKQFCVNHSILYSWHSSIAEVVLEKQFRVQRTEKKKKDEATKNCHNKATISTIPIR